jgi:uncharacterized protein YceH (UPF0502 family)
MLSPAAYRSAILRRSPASSLGFLPKLTAKNPLTAHQEGQNMSKKIMSENVVADLENRVDELEELIAELDERLLRFGRNGAGLEGRVADLEGRVDDLEDDQSAIMKRLMGGTKEGEE